MENNGHRPLESRHLTLFESANHKLTRTIQKALAALFFFFSQANHIARDHVTLNEP